MNHRFHVICEARTWIGTKFVHGAGVKGAGVDCAHLVSEVFEKLHLIPHISYPVYGPDFFRHGNDEEKYIICEMKKHFNEVTADQVGAGDVVVLKFGRVYSHCVILTTDGKGLQAWPSHGMVSEVNLKEEKLWRKSPKRYFTVKLDERTQD